MRHRISLQVGPVGFRIGSDWRAPIAALDALYRDYPRAEFADYSVRLEATSFWRRWVRPSVRTTGDYHLPDAAPLPLAQGLLAAEMGMNLQVALGHRRHLLLHAAVVARGDRAMLLSGVSGAGKSTLALMLSERGWRFLGDEFAMIDPATGWAHPFPRPISLKNESLGVIPAGRLVGPLLSGTPKGEVRHVAPDAAAIAAMMQPARPALLVFPRFGHPLALQGMAPTETFVRLTQASTNYVALGEAGFRTLTRLRAEVPAVALDYPDGEAGVAAVESIWSAL
ncbi:HprK-related kinase A [uncultured Sphingomonas sp.]|uniref:HprK-related kinase A n=1 Tax=uncultured Sphingomonas sp. TaxID=158754 RepID=UPI0025E958AD|nr:HprK-related kinase A [uncultured Sphingomonas sp.]